MSYTYSQRKQAGPISPKSEAAAPKPSPEMLSNGAMQPAEELKGRRVDLPDAMRAKMENAFGADLNAVKLYESRAVADTGAKAIARGAEIAFAPGMLDFTSYGGQALLGHEISHVVSQARGEVTGGGFLSDASLEARADREGAMAAAGQTVAPPTASLSPVTADAAAGPMQAKDKPEKYERQAQEFRAKESDAYDRYVMADSPDEKAALEQEYRLNRDQKAAKLKRAGRTEEEIGLDHRKTTDVMQQLMRAHERNVVIPTNLERAEADKAEAARYRADLSAGQRAAANEAAINQAANERAGHYSDYLGNLQKILGTMSDEELRAQPQVQMAMVDSYTAAHRAYAAAQKSNPGMAAPMGAFLPNRGEDLLGTMYARLMGQEDIGAMLTRGTQDEAITDITARMEESGVKSLLERQLAATYRGGFYGTGNYFKGNVEKEADTMRGFWTNAVMPAAAKNPQAAGTAAEMNATLTQITNQHARDRSGFQYIPKTNRPLTAEAGGDYLLALTPNESGRPRPGPMPDPEPEPEPAPAPEPAVPAAEMPKQKSSLMGKLKRKLGRSREPSGLDPEMEAAEKAARERFKQRQKKAKRGGK